MKTIFLIDLKANETAKILGITGCCKARRRLCEIGLNKGTSVRMIKNDFGPLILNLSGHKLALGRGLASNIMIEC